jgi:hypothetical protein
VIQFCFSFRHAGAPCLTYLFFLSGCFRTYWDGKTMISRLGNPFTPPQWFINSTYSTAIFAQPSLTFIPSFFFPTRTELPKDMTLDGELFTGRGEFQSTVSVVKTINSPHWQNITFQVRCCSAFSLLSTFPSELH